MHLYQIFLSSFPPFIYSDGTEIRATLSTGDNITYYGLSGNFLSGEGQALMIHHHVRPVKVTSNPWRNNAEIITGLIEWAGM